jgi:hypothetical protein
MLAGQSSTRDVLPHTLPLGGLVNHSDHVFMSGCLTLKFSGSWKTVRTSPSAAALVDFSLLSPEPPVGEMGIVSSGTCWSGWGAVATSAIVNVWEWCRRGAVLDSRVEPRAMCAGGCVRAAELWVAEGKVRAGRRSRARRFPGWLLSRGYAA